MAYQPRPAVNPSAPLWVRATPNTTTGAGLGVFIPLVVLGTIVFMIAGFALFDAGPAAVLPLMALYAGLPLAGRRAQRHLFHPPDWKVGKTRVAGEALELVADIQARFDWAKHLMDELPRGGVRWADVGQDADAVVWDAVEHAVEVSRLDEELQPFVYAQSGTAQAVLKAQLLRERDDHRHVLLKHQRTADGLMKEAGNALAAARVALTRNGSVAPVALPAAGRPALHAGDRLAEAKSRLSMLAGAWAELDESGEVLGEQLGLNEPPAG